MSNGPVPNHSQGWPPPAVYAPGPRRRWVGMSLAAAAGAVAAATTATVITTHVDSQRISAASKTTTATVTATVTATATPPPPSTPAPLPPAQADRQTCDAWHDAGDRIHDATHTLAAIPKGSTILDPQVRDNPVLSDSVRKAAQSYDQAAVTLAAGIAPGATPVLYQSATAAAAALHALSIGDATFDAAAGNTYHVVREAADTLDVLCNRLAPR